MINSRIETQNDLENRLDIKNSLPSSFNLTRGKELSVRSEHIPRLLHTDLKKLSLGGHGFQGDSKEILRKALLNYRKIENLSFYNQLSPKFIGAL